MKTEEVGLTKLAEMIYNYCGIDYRKDISALESKIKDRLNALGVSAWEYCGYLKIEPNEWDALVELITVNETYFFREENALEEFQKEVLPQYVKRTPENPLLIWSAACSTGEEPYTLGMLVEQSGLFSRGAVKIIATDINKKALHKAKSGLYKKKSMSFRRMPPEFYDRFFIEFGDYYKVKESIMEMVEFKHMNLLDDKMREKMGKVDIIFCRNVLIYFDDAAIKKIIDAFYNILNPGGYLFLGHAESITHLKTGFKAIYTPSTFYYKKGEKI